MHLLSRLKDTLPYIDPQIPISYVGLEVSETCVASKLFPESWPNIPSMQLAHSWAVKIWLHAQEVSGREHQRLGLETDGIRGTKNDHGCLHSCSQKIQAHDTMTARCLLLQPEFGGNIDWDRCGPRSYAQPILAKHGRIFMPSHTECTENGASLPQVPPKPNHNCDMPRATSSVLPPPNKINKLTRVLGFFPH